MAEQSRGAIFILTWVGEAHGEVLRTGAVPLTTVMRRLLCYWAVRELGLAGTAVTARLGLTQSAVSRAVRRRGRLAQEQRLVFPQG